MVTKMTAVHIFIFPTTRCQDLVVYNYPDISERSFYQFFDISIFVSINGMDICFSNHLNHLTVY